MFRNRFKLAFSRSFLSKGASVLASSIVLLGASLAVSTEASAATSPLKVSGTDIVNSAGTAVKLQGVNRSGSEYKCQQDGTIFVGPTDQASIDVMKSWKINVVRIPLNEHCWLGIDWAPNSTGTAYQNAIADYVNRLANNGIYSILDLHFTGPEAVWGEQSKEMANRRYSVPFWKSVGTKFKNSPSVLFELYNEPHDINWNCWKNGCTTWEGWQAAGMQELVNAVRSSGATQPVILNGLDWGHDMSQLVANLPTDPAKALVAGQHLYNFKLCVDENCWNQQWKPIAQKMPFLAPEIGVNDCNAALPIRYMKWSDANGGDGYGFWHFGTGGCPEGTQFGGSALLTDWNGSTSRYGTDIKKYLQTATTTPGTNPTTTTTTIKPTTTTTTTKPTTTTTTPTGTACAASQYKAEYYNSTDLSGSIVARGCDDLVKFDWGTGSPKVGVNSDSFSARWTRNVYVGGGNYGFSVTGDDGIRLYIDNQLVLNGWKNQGPTTYSATKALPAGTHSLRLEYFENTGGALSKLSWSKVP